MKKRLCGSICIGLLLTISGTSAAQGQAGPGRGPAPDSGQAHGEWLIQKFEDADRNRDGKVDYNEYMNAVRALADRNFKAADTNGDNALSRDEFRAAVRRHHRGMQEGQGGRMGGSDLQDQPDEPVAPQAPGKRP